MLGNTITVDGYSSRSVGLFCKQLPMFPIAIESKDALTVGGRLSNMYKSAHFYNDITVEIEAVLLGLNVDIVAQYFSQGKKLSFSHIPDRYAIIRQLVAIDQTRVGNGALELRITLKCDPFKFCAEDQSVVFQTEEQQLFNGSGITSGYYVKSTTGDLVEASGWNASGFIDVRETDYIIVQGIQQSAYYNEQKEYLGNFGSITDVITTETQFEIPSGASFIRCSISNGRLPTAYYKVPNGSYNFQVGGNFYAEPVLFAQGCTDGFSIDLNGVEFSTSGLTGNIYIDVPRRMAYQIGAGGVKTVVNEHTAGKIWDLILIPDDMNYLDIFGATKIQLTKNERWL